MRKNIIFFIIFLVILTSKIFAQTISIFVVEISENTFNKNTALAHSIKVELEGDKKEITVYNRVLTQREYELIDSCNDGFIQELNSKLENNFYLFVKIECDRVFQLEVDGKKYNLFHAYSNIKIEIIETSSPASIVFSCTQYRIRGQGGNEERAVSDSLIWAAEKVLSMIQLHRAEILAVLSEAKLK
jgi:hypothetical protein